MIFHSFSYHRFDCRLMLISVCNSLWQCSWFQFRNRATSMMHCWYDCMWSISFFCDNPARWCGTWSTFSYLQNRKYWMNQLLHFVISSISSGMMAVSEIQTFYQTLWIGFNLVISCWCIKLMFKPCIITIARLYFDHWIVASDICQFTQSYEDDPSAQRLRWLLLLCIEGMLHELHLLQSPVWWQPKW